MSTTITSISQAQSLASVRNFLRCAITHIAYIRDLCPDSSFAFKDILGVKMRLLVPNHEQSVALVDSIENGVFDALRKGYLRELDLCIYNDDLTDVLESYVFLFEFSEDGTQVQMKVQAGGVNDGDDDSGPKSIPSHLMKWKPNHRPRSPSGHCSGREARQILLGMLSQLTNFIDQLPPLNQKSQIGLRLLYHDSKTPSDYVPPGYAEASPLMRLLYYKELRFNVPTSVSAATSHHYVGFSLRSATLANLRAQLLSSKHKEEEKESEDADNLEDTCTPAPLTQDESDERLTLPSSSHTSFCTARPGLSSSQRTPRMRRSSHSIRTEKRASSLNAARGSRPSGERNGKGAAYAREGIEGIVEESTPESKVERNSDALLTGALEGAMPCHQTSKEASCEVLTTTTATPAGISLSGGEKNIGGKGKGTEKITEERASHKVLDVVWKPEMLNLVPTVLDLASSSRTYSRREVAFLLLALTIFSFSPNVPGGRGVITGGDVARFLMHSCVVEVSEDWCFTAMRRLVLEGYLQVMNPPAASLSSGSQQHEQKLSSVQKWKVLSAPISILKQLIQHQELKELLAPTTLQALHELIVLSNVASSKRRNALYDTSTLKLDLIGSKSRIRRQKRMRTDSIFG